MSCAETENHCSKSPQNNTLVSPFTKNSLYRKGRYMNIGMLNKKLGDQIKLSTNAIATNSQRLSGILFFPYTSDYAVNCLAPAVNKTIV